MMSTESRRSPLAVGSGLLCFVLVVGGASGLLNEWLGWFRVFGFLRFLAPEGYEVYSYVVMIAVGAVIGAAGERAGR
ncbi:hypothetical protein [Streptomyces sp. NPDC127098]|uniref:hypothetical protein n=1 Tax=Streptomyces sp. NPDC127098 TaxID=3347137 RepID=UPI00364EDDBA